VLVQENFIDVKCGIWRFFLTLLYISVNVEGKILLIGILYLGNI